MAAPIIKIKRSAVPGKKPTLEQLSLGELALNTDSGEIYVRRERESAFIILLIHRFRKFLF